MAKNLREHNRRFGRYARLAYKPDIGEVGLQKKYICVATIEGEWDYVFPWLHVLRRSVSSADVACITIEGKFEIRCHPRDREKVRLQVEYGKPHLEKKGPRVNVCPKQ
jgi:hypothetical protein